MTTDVQTQTVTETTTETTAAQTATAQAEVKENGAQDELDTLLKEYDDQLKAAPTETPAVPEKKLETLEKAVQDLTADRSRERTEKALTGAVTEVKKLEGLEHVDSDVLQDLIFARANRDGRFALAILNGDKKAIRTFGKSIESRFSMPDRKLTADQKAAREAVSGASLQPPPPATPDFGKMSDKEFFAYERSLQK